MLRKASFLIGRTRVLSVEEAVAVIREVMKGKLVAPVTEASGEWKHFEPLPKISRMRTDPNSFWPSLDALRFTADSVDEEILQGLLDDAPDSIGFTIVLAKANRKPRGYNSMLDVHGTGIVISRARGSYGTRVHIAIGPDFEIPDHSSLAMWRKLIDTAGYGEDAIRLQEDGEGRVVASFRDDLPCAEHSNPAAPDYDRVMVSSCAYNPPEISGGRLGSIGFSAYTRPGGTGFGPFWEDFKAIWNKWRAAIPSKHEVWALTVKPEYANWNENREWINRTIPGPFEGIIRWGTETDDVVRLLIEETGAGEYVELCWKRVGGRVLVVAGVRESGGWRLDLIGTKDVGPEKAEVTRKVFEKLTGRDDLFVP